MGTTIEGDLDAAMDTALRALKAPLEAGAEGVFTVIKVAHRRGGTATVTSAGQGRVASLSPGNDLRYSTSLWSRNHDRPRTVKPTGALEQASCIRSSIRPSLIKASCNGGGATFASLQCAAIARIAWSSVRRLNGRCRFPRATSTARATGGGWTIRRPGSRL